MYSWIRSFVDAIHGSAIRAAVRRAGLGSDSGGRAARHVRHVPERAMSSYLLDSQPRAPRHDLERSGGTVTVLRTAKTTDEPAEGGMRLRGHFARFNEW